MNPLPQKHTKLRQPQKKRVLRTLLPHLAQSRSTAFPSPPGEVSITETGRIPDFHQLETCAARRTDKKTEPADSVFLL